MVAVPVVFVKAQGNIASFAEMKPERDVATILRLPDPPSLDSIPRLAIAAEV